MRKFQRYAFWIIGIGVMVHVFAQLANVAWTYFKYYNDKSDVTRFSWVDTLLWTGGSLIQALAIAFLCMFAARICKLEEDLSFKDDLNKIVRSLRSAGDKT